MNEDLNYHLIAIKCKSCENNWSLNISLSGNHVEPFAAVCDCSALIIGNFNFLEFQNKQNSENPNDHSKKIYLTNGHFEILQMKKNEILKLPNLHLE
ncbi:MAG: hypothetical protein HeimC2_09860 [Candidatus Heimdallarchaeota archaeon LC_2]|nr:MAG: hypothetical protein HeimC2_09860 [Candidatus Heimdallarchaeota archaeon LC_2]